MNDKASIINEIKKLLPLAPLSVLEFVFYYLLR